MNKLKILIVEDDANVRRYLHDFISSQEQDCIVVAEADNGLLGAEMAQKVNPDLIITDICMPVLDGLGMMERLSGRHFEYLILSGYDEFVFLKKALKYGVTDYLLKPIAGEELLQAIAQVKHKIAGQKKQISADSMEYVRQHCIRDILSRSEPMSRSEDFFDLFSADGDYFAVAFLESDQALGQLLSETEKSFERFETVLLSESLALVIHTSKTAISREQLSGQYERLFGSELAHFALNICARDRIVECIRSTYRCIQWQKISGDRECRYAEQLPERKPNEETLDGLFRSLYQSMDEGDGEAVSQDLDDLFIEAFLIDDFVKFKKLILKCIFHVENKYAYSFHITDGISDEQIDQAQDLSKLKECTNRILQRVLDLKSNSVRYNKITCDAISFIRKHYADITVESAAKELYISPSYLLYVFKKDTGKSFNSYVIDYRMEQACELLKAGKKVYEVSNMVGYKSVKFFSTLFKKKFDISPSQYVKNLSGGRSI